MAEILSKMECLFLVRISLIVILIGSDDPSQPQGFYLIIYLVTLLRGLWGLISVTKDGMQALSSERAES